MVMYLVAGYNMDPMAHPTRRGFLMSQKYVWRLTASERQWLHRIAKGRCGRRRPPGWKRERARALLQCDEGPEGEGWPDEAIAAALDVSARSVSRWRASPRYRGPAAWMARAKRNSCSWPNLRRRPAWRAGRCGRWPASG